MIWLFIIELFEAKKGGFMERIFRGCNEPISKKLLKIKPETQVCADCFRDLAQKKDFVLRVDEGIAGTRKQYWEMRDLPFSQD